MLQSRMSFWLHCNTCFKLLGDGCFFFLTSCGHIFCEKCEQRGWRQKCLICGTPEPTVIQLTGQLPAHVQIFVSDAASMLRRHSDPHVRQFAATLDWQNAHRKRYFNHLKGMISQQKNYTDNLKQEFQKYIEGREKQSQARIEALQKIAMSRLEKQKEEFQKYLETLKKEAQQRLEKQSSEFHDHVIKIEKENIKVHDENTYLKRLVGQKNSPAQMSPSGDRGNRPSSSPTMRGLPSSSPTSLLHSSVKGVVDRLHGQYSTHQAGYRGSPSNFTSFRVSPNTSATASTKDSCSNPTCPRISPTDGMVSGKMVTKTPLVSQSGSKLTPAYALHQNVPGIEEKLWKLQSSQNLQAKTPQSVITTGRVTMRTPPSGGRLGIIPSTYMPSPQFVPKTPKSVPHPMNF